MPRGKKLLSQDTNKILTSYAKTKSCEKTAKNLNMSISSVYKVVSINREWKKGNEFLSDKSNEFTDKASELIDMGLEFLDMRFKRAISAEKALLEKKLNPEELKNIPKLGEITTAISALYDKRTAARNEATLKEDININISIV